MFLMKQPAVSIRTDVVRLGTSGRAGGVSRAAFTTFRPSAGPWTCPDCRETRRKGHGAGVQEKANWRRQISTTLRKRDERPSDARKPIDSISNAASTDPETNAPASSSSSLPSHTDNQRSQLSKRASRILDELLARVSVASQHINAYTGTDYSGIEALRREIIEQEQKTRSYHTAVDEAKAKHHDAYAKQTSAQREIVRLLERKSSWSPSDLERYMSLVRSEHLNEQDVQVAKDNLAVAERELEDARSLLERLERKQYHEEQIWSDTIRRNSTWVTFGLMGVNILLLLAQIAIFEPYRRKKIVKDVKSALDEKTLSAAPTTMGVQKQIDAAQDVGPAQAAKELDQPLDMIVPAAEKDVGTTPESMGRMLPLTSSVKAQIEASPAQPPSTPNNPHGTLEVYQEAIRDLFSERIVQLRKVDVTNTAVQGAATGVAIMGLLFVLLRPK